MKERIKADVQMVREYLNVIILKLGILILFVPLAAQAHVIFNHKIVLSK